MRPDDSSLCLAAELGAQLARLGRRVATVESCTAGGVAWLLTAVAGSSQWFERGFVTYSNAAKMDMVGVARHILDAHGAVSVETAAAMAQGGLRAAAADYCIAVTGVAGPDGGSAQKPVGTVCFAWADRRGDSVAERAHFDGDRHAIRAMSAAYALQGLVDLVRNRDSASVASADSAKTTASAD